MSDTQLRVNPYSEWQKYMSATSCWSKLPGRRSILQKLLSEWQKHLSASSCLRVAETILELSGDYSSTAALSHRLPALEGTNYGSLHQSRRSSRRGLVAYFPRCIEDSYIDETLIEIYGTRILEISSCDCIRGIYMNVASRNQGATNTVNDAKEEGMFTCPLINLANPSVTLRSTATTSPLWRHFVSGASREGLARTGT